METKIEHRKRTSDQDRLLKCPSQEVLSDGPIRSAKTTGIALDCIERCEKYPGIPAVMLRKNSVDLEETVEQTFKRTLLTDEAKNWPWEQIVHAHPLLSEWRAKPRLLLWKNGSTTKFWFLRDQRGHVAIGQMGAEYGFIGVSQAEQLKRDEISFLRTRLSAKKFPLRMDLECNPDSKEHPLYKDYIEDPLPGTARVRFYLKHNLQNLPPGFLEDQLKNRDRNFVRRFIEGEWGVIYEGAVYGMFLDEFYPTGNLFDRAETITGFESFIVGIDWGFDHPCAFRLWGKRFDGVKILMESIVVQRHTLPMLLPLWLPHIERYKPRAIYVPHDRPDLAKDLYTQTNWPIAFTDNSPGSKQAGITHMQGGYGTRTMVWCSDISRKDLEIYHYLDSIRKEDTGNEGADSMDADRYGLYGDEQALREQTETTTVTAEDLDPGMGRVTIGGMVGGW